MNFSLIAWKINIIQIIRLEKMFTMLLYENCKTHHNSNQIKIACHHALSKKLSIIIIFSDIKVYIKVGYSVYF